MGLDQDLAPASRGGRVLPRGGRKARKSEEALRLVRRPTCSELDRAEATRVDAQPSVPCAAPQDEQAASNLQESRKQVARLRAENFALRREIEQLTIFRHLALRDELTGVHNRRSFEEGLRREWSRAQRCLEPLSVLSLDLDAFKPINDSFGHAVGDGVLRWFAQQLVEACREMDLVCRMGGDEFAILLPGTDALGAEIMGQRLERRMEQAADAPRLPGGGAVRFSWGAASRDDGARSPTELLMHADEAMYRHKRRRATAMLGKVAAA
jgi:diguanylate cyclase (GGDEF)-like protein